jgi:hypothetical protein
MIQPTFYAGLDLGQAQDPSAFAIAERRWVQERPDNKACRNVGRWRAHYDVRHLQRWRLGTPYPDIVANVDQMTSEPPLRGCQLGIDETGVGKAVVDMFRQAKIKARLVPITITAGHTVTFGMSGYHIPKRELASTMQALLQGERIKFAKLPETPTLVKELQSFKVKINTATGNETFEAWRERDHDDLCFAVMVAVWLGQRDGGPVSPLRVIHRGPQLHNPYSP